MRGPMVALIVPLGGGPIDPGFGNWGGVGGPRPDQGLPGGQGGYPSQPIYHPGHPDHGLPAYPSHPIAPGGGQGGYPSQPIYHPGHPDHGLPAYPDQGLPPGGEDIPNNELPIPEPPADFEDDVVIAIHRPGEEWVIKAYEQDARPDQGLPPTPAPKARK